MNRIALLAVTTLALTGGVVLAEDQPALDRNYLEQAAPHCDAMTKYAELGEKRATDPEVREYARRVGEGFRELHKEMARTTEDRKPTANPAAEKATRDEVERLSRLSGKEFDQAFLKRIIDDQEAAIRKCEAQATQGKDQKLRDFARTAQQKMQENVREGKRLAEKIKSN